MNTQILFQVLITLWTAFFFTPACADLPGKLVALQGRLGQLKDKLGELKTVLGELKKGLEKTVISPADKAAIESLLNSIRDLPVPKDILGQHALAGTIQGIVTNSSTFDKNDIKSVFASYSEDDQKKILKTIQNKPALKDQFKYLSLSAAPAPQSEPTPEKPPSGPPPVGQTPPNPPPSGPPPATKPTSSGEKQTSFVDLIKKGTTLRKTEEGPKKEKPKAEAEIFTSFGKKVQEKKETLSDEEILIDEDSDTGSGWSDEEEILPSSPTQAKRKKEQEEIRKQNKLKREKKKREELEQKEQKQQLQARELEKLIAMRDSGNYEAALPAIQATAWKQFVENLNWDQFNKLHDHQTEHDSWKIYQLTQLKQEWLTKKRNWVINNIKSIDKNNDVNLKKLRHYPKHFSSLLAKLTDNQIDQLSLKSFLSNDPTIASEKLLRTKGNKLIQILNAAKDNPSNLSTAWTKNEELFMQICKHPQLVKGIESLVEEIKKGNNKGHFLVKSFIKKFEETKPRPLPSTPPKSG